MNYKQIVLYLVKVKVMLQFISKQKHYSFHVISFLLLLNLPRKPLLLRINPDFNGKNPPLIVDGSIIEGIKHRIMLYWAPVDLLKRSH